MAEQAENHRLMGMPESSVAQDRTLVRVNENVIRPPDTNRMFMPDGYMLPDDKTGSGTVLLQENFSKAHDRERPAAAEADKGSGTLSS